MNRAVLFLVATCLGWPCAALAAPTLSLLCVPKPDLSGPVPDPIDTISVTYWDSEWIVVHTAASGKYYVRSEQYEIKDTSVEKGTWGWVGLHKRKKNVGMVSVTYKLGDGYAYAETVSDVATGQILAEVNAHCVERSSLATNAELSGTTAIAAFPRVEQRPVNRSSSEGGKQAPPAPSARNLSAQFNMSGGTPQIPVLINDRLSLDFIIDSGATDVSIPSDVALTLVRTGTIADGDFLGSSDYTLADGRTSSSSRINIRSLSVGGVTLHNVTASVANATGPLLLGESFLSRLPKWTINNETQVFEFDHPLPTEGGLSSFKPASSQSSAAK
jgi:clan AA aspartic protease (TIGR02281 family)